MPWIQSFGGAKGRFHCRWLSPVVLLFALMAGACGNRPEKASEPSIEEIATKYIEAWKAFYPSRAFSSGDRDSAFRFESFTPERIEAWVSENAEALKKLDALSPASPADLIDRDLLSRRLHQELARWQGEADHRRSPMFYAGSVSQALTYVLVHEGLTTEEKVRAILMRLKGVRELCAAGRNYLENGPAENGKGALKTLERTAHFYEHRLTGILAPWTDGLMQTSATAACRETAEAIKALIAHIQGLPLDLPDIMGKQAYAEQLARYTGMDLKPETLEAQALEEMRRVRAEMAGLARQIWSQSIPDRKPPEDEAVLFQEVLERMEANREDNQADFLKLFVDLTNRAEAFVRDAELATVPEKRTLIVGLSPEHFAGAAIGGVYTAGPFDPDANTLFYIPSIPDEAPEAAKEGFYRSFNNHFNSMIIAHEMFPGHYLQFKIASRNPRLVRSLFSDAVFGEGWGTFCEVLALEAGWDRDPLTMMAHLRKRLENATRAYVSVKVHCDGWDKDRLTEFAVKEGLLAPQFAVNLWDRVIRSPLQLTTYFLGSHKIAEVYEAQKEKLGDRFSLREFSDTLLQAGGVPVTHLPLLFENGQ